MRKGARAKDFEVAITWLKDAGLIYKIHRVNKIEYPLKFYEDFDVFKIFPLDFAVQTEKRVIPLEAKAKENVYSKSLRTHIDEHPKLKGLRVSMLNYIDQGWMENLPLYAIEKVISAKRGYQCQNKGNETLPRDMALPRACLPGRDFGGAFLSGQRPP